MKKYFLNLLILLFSSVAFVYPLYANETEMTIPVSPEVDISVERFSASGDYLIIWLAPEYGLRSNHRFMARQLAQQGIEVWLNDIIESLYLPHSTQSIKQLDGKYVADLIDHAYKTTGKKVILAGDSYAALHALQGAHQWQQKSQKSSYFIGAILFSPSLYAYIPSLGLPPEFMPVSKASNIPIMIYQAQKSGNLTQFKLLTEQLQQHDNPVYSKIIPDVRSLFYTQDPTREMLAQIKLLSPNIRKMISVLAKHPVPDKAIPMQQIKINRSRMDSSLKKFRAKNDPQAINLADAYGNMFTKQNFKGQITIVNFWATWCPPCVQEIPSLNRLKQAMAEFPFELISINYAEDKDTILSFMEQVNVEFPVLLDQNGDYAKKWNVITYPSTFIIGPDGKIKYGVNAAIEWDDPEYIKQIKALL